MIDSNENVRYDCSRGCVISGNEETGVEDIRYRQGCCKLEVYGTHQTQSRAPPVLSFA